MAFQPDIIVIGAGASGLAAAVSAAECGAAVLVLEANRKPGTKLLRTGNGKCNLTNKGNSGNAYRGCHPEFAAEVLSNFTVSDTLDFFSRIGIPVIDRDGWVYPRSEEARSVLSALLRRAEQLGVRIKLGDSVIDVSKEDNGYCVATTGWKYRARRLILSFGSCASPSGSDFYSSDPDEFFGYRIAEKLGMKVMPVLPALTGIRLKENFTKEWAGVRVTAELALIRDGREIYRERGQVQLTDYGISGIPAFILSSYISRGIEAGTKCEISMHLLPDLSEKELKALLASQAEALGNAGWKEMLCGILPEKLIPAFLKGVPKQAEADCLIRKITDWRFIAAGTLDLSRSQVAAGGISTEGISPLTLESQKNRGLFVTGECLDIDAVCGGWNLQFAWSSGILAGCAAAGKSLISD